MDKKGKVQFDLNKNKMYKRDDFIGLLNLINKFDSRLHGMKDYKLFLKLKDHLFDHWSKENKNLDLSLDEATFLKTYLSELTTKDGKDTPLAEFEMRTLIGTLDQLE